MMKNRLTMAPAIALGYSWHTRATNIDHATPPKKPFTLEYIALPKKKAISQQYHFVDVWLDHTLCPKLDASQGITEYLNIWDKTQDLISHS
jgi:hypothetical protein